MSDIKPEKPKSLFTSLSLLKDSVEFIRKNVQVLALILSAPIVLDALFTYFVVADAGATEDSQQLSQNTFFTFSALLNFAYWLISFYLRGIVYHSTQRLFLFQERPHYPTFLKSPGVIKTVFYVFVIDVFSLCLIALFAAPFALSMWFEEQYPDQFWPMAIMVVTVVPLLIAVYRVIGWVTRVMFALPMACLNDTINIWSDLKRANEMGKGHVKTFVVAIIIMVLAFLVIPAVMLFLPMEADMIVSAFEGTFFGELILSVFRVASSFDIIGWLTLLVMIVMYCIAFQALERDETKTED